MLPMRSTARLLPALAALTLAAAAHAQDWPSQPIRLLVGSPPGAPSDIVARSVADQLGTSLGQPLVVENRPGAGLNLAAGQVAAAKPDGHTLLVTSDTVMTVNPLIYSNLTFDARRDLTPVSVLASFTQMLVCNTGVGVKSVEELLDKARQDKLTYASGGAGVPGHLAAEMFLAEAGIEMTHIPYRGPGPAITDVAGGQVDCGFLTTPQVLPQVQAGRLVALAVSSARRSPLAPDVPAAAEVGVPGMDATFYQFLMAPAGTPADVIERMQHAAAEALAAPAVRERLAALDMAPVASSAAEAAAQLERDGERWREIIERIDLKVE